MSREDAELVLNLVAGVVSLMEMGGVKVGTATEEVGAQGVNVKSRGSLNSVGTSPFGRAG